MAHADADYRTAIAAFLAYVATQDPAETLYLGIDPGLTGAIALICRRRCCVVDIPVITSTKTKTRTLKQPVPGGPKTQRYQGSANWFDDAAILDLFRLLRPVRSQIVVALEIAQVTLGGSRAGNTPLTAYRTGASWNMWPLFLMSKGYPVHQFRPSVWKKQMGLEGKDKEASRARALQLYPRADLLRKRDHDRAEALLLAHHLKRQLEGIS